jgi:hypothetical protein
VAEFLGVVGIIRERIIDLAHQQILAIGQAGHTFYHPLTIMAFYSIVNFFVLRKS